MKELVFFVYSIIITISIKAQLPEDVLRYSFQPINSSARIQAVGGAMGSLGGDISAMYVNPAGLGFYKTREVFLTPTWNMKGVKSSYRGMDEQRYNNSFGIGPIGIAGSFGLGYSKPNTSLNFSIGVTQTANFRNIISYKGLNNFSSASEQYAEEIAKSGLSIDDIIKSPQYAFGSSLALDTYLTDTVSSGGITKVKSLPEYLLENGQAILQENRIETSGSMNELAIAVAINKNDKWFFGGTLGIPFVNYKQITDYKESDPSGNTTNKFGYYELHDELRTTGAGVNLKLGAIYKPAEFIRIGLAFHTPTIMSMLDRRNTTMTTDTENGANGVYTSSSSKFTPDGLEGRTSYLNITPWKAILSASYVFREIEDVRKQRAFVTADVEYVGYNSASFHTSGESSSVGDDAYYRDLNSVIRNYYKGAFNVRLGGELKFNTIMFRAGYAHYGNPYRDEVLKASKDLLSTGIGYRNKGIFIDLTYVYNMGKEVNFPYHLDKPNTFATTQQNGLGSVVLTFGSKF